MTFKGINFRSTAGYVTDPADTTYALAAAYPTTRGGLTFGWTDAFATTSNSSTTIDPRLAGGHQTTSSGRYFRIDLPNGPGTYKIRFAGGSFGAAWTGQVDFFDGAKGGTRLFQLSQTTSVAAASFIDAMGNVHTSTDWPANQVERTITCTNSYITVALVSASYPMYWRHIALEYQALPLVDATLTDETGAALSTIYERNPNNSRIARINASASTALSLLGADAAYFQIVTIGTQKWLAHSAAALTIAGAGANADVTIRQTDATAPNGPNYDTAFSIPITSAGAKPTDTSLYGLIETQNWLNIVRVRAVTDNAWAGYSGSYVAAPGAIDTVVTTYAQFVSALAAIADGRTVWDRIQIAAGVYSGAAITDNFAYGAGGGLLIEPVAGADPEFNIEFASLGAHGLHVRNLRSPGVGITYNQWRFATPGSGGINGSGKFNKVVFTECQLGWLYSPGVSASTVAAGGLTQIFMAHGESLRIENCTFWGTPNRCIIATGVRAIVIKHNEGRQLNGDFFVPANAHTYNSLQGVFADNHVYFDVRDNSIRNEIDYAGYTAGFHGDFMQINAFGDNMSLWATSQSGWAVGDKVLNMKAATPAVYQVASITTGTTAASGTGPSGTGSGIVDGGVTWNWVANYVTASSLYGVLEDNDVNSAQYLADDGTHRQFLIDSNPSKNCPAYISAINNASGTHSRYGMTIDGGFLWAEFNALVGPSSFGVSPATNNQQILLIGSASGRALHNVVCAASAESSTGGLIVDDEVVVSYSSAAASPNRYQDKLIGPFAQISTSANRWGYPSLQDDGVNSRLAFKLAMRSILAPLSGTAGIFPEGPLIGPDNGLLYHTSGSPLIEWQTDIAPTSASSAISSTSPALAAGSTIAPDDALHAHIAGEPVLTTIALLVPAHGTLAQTAGEPAISAKSTLDVDSSVLLFGDHPPELVAFDPITPPPLVLPTGTVLARQGDTLDALIWREAALGPAALIQVFEVNPGLADRGPVLPAGTLVKIPDIPPAANSISLIQLWD